MAPPQPNHGGRQRPAHLHHRPHAAVGVLAAGALFTALGGSYARVGAAASFIYGLGILVIWLAPETNRQSLAK